MHNNREKMYLLVDGVGFCTLGTCSLKTVSFKKKKKKA